jgi:hypothetical protein
MNLGRALARATRRLCYRGGSPAKTGTGKALRAARRAQALRRQRTELSAVAGLFGEPPWDIMLELFIAAGEGRTASAGELCAASQLAGSTLIRWLGILEARGVVMQANDGQLVTLSADAREALQRFFDRP